MAPLRGYERSFDTVLPLETLDSIMEHLPVGPPLNAVAATSKALLSLARPRIFRDVPLESTYSLCAYAALIARIPYLPLYARSLRVGPRRYVMTEVVEPAPVKEDFEDLIWYANAMEYWQECIDTRFADLQRKDRLTWWDASELPETLAALSRVDELAIYSLRWGVEDPPALRDAFAAFTQLSRLHLDAVVFERMADLQKLLRPLHRLSELELVEVTLDESSGLSEARSGEPCLALTSLVVAGDTAYPPPFIGWLAGLLAPAGLRRLLTIWSSEPWRNYVHPGDDLMYVPGLVLPRAGSTIEQLEFYLDLGDDPDDAEEWIESLGLSQCRSLRSIKLRLGDFTDAVGLSWLASLLTNIASPYISEIVLDVDARWPAPEDLPPFPTLTPILRALRRPILQNLDILHFRSDDHSQRLFCASDLPTGARALDSIPLALARRFGAHINLNPKYERERRLHYAYDVRDVGLEPQDILERQCILIVQTHLVHPIREFLRGQGMLRGPLEQPKEYVAGLIFLPHVHASEL